eukprot:tig00020531_g10061.t1
MLLRSAAAAGRAAVGARPSILQAGHPELPAVQWKRWSSSAGQPPDAIGETTEGASGDAPVSATSPVQKADRPLGRAFVANYIQGGVNVSEEQAAGRSFHELAFPDKCYNKDTGELDIGALPDSSVKRHVLPAWRRAARRFIETREWIQTDFVYRRGHVVHVALDEAEQQWRVVEGGSSGTPGGWRPDAEYFPAAADGRQHVMPEPLFRFLKQLALERAARRAGLADDAGFDPETPGSVEEARARGETFDEYVLASFDMPRLRDPEEGADEEARELAEEDEEGAQEPQWVDYAIQDADLPPSMLFGAEEAAGAPPEAVAEAVPPGSDPAAEEALDAEADYVRAGLAKRRAEAVMDYRAELESGEFGLDEAEEVEREEALREGQLAQYLLDVRRTTNQTKSGKVSRYAALVVVGNGRGLVGYAVGKGAEPEVAVERAYRKAETRMFHIDLDPGGVLPHSVLGNYVQTKVVITSSPWELPVAHEAVHAVLDGAGVKFCTAKIVGSRNVQNVVRSTIHGLLQCRSAETRSREAGRYIPPNKFCLHVAGQAEQELLAVPAS